MRIFCFGCGDPVTNEVPPGTIFRAVAECPRCVVKPDSLQSRLALAEKREAILLEALEGHFGAAFWDSTCGIAYKKLSESEDDKK